MLIREIMIWMIYGSGSGVESLWVSPMIAEMFLEAYNAIQ